MGRTSTSPSGAARHLAINGEDQHQPLRRWAPPPHKWDQHQPLRRCAPPSTSEEEQLQPLRRFAPPPHEWGGSTSHKWGGAVPYGAVAAWSWQPAAFISSSACSPVSSFTAAHRLTRTRTWNAFFRASSALARTQ